MRSYASLIAVVEPLWKQLLHMMNQMFYGREPHAREEVEKQALQNFIILCVCEPTPKYSPLREPTVVKAERDIVKVEQWEMQASVCRAGRILRILSTSPNSLIFQLGM